MAVLLTGGAGYIGSHTAVELLNAGKEILIADNYSNSGRDVVDRIARITGKSVTAYEADVTDSTAMERIFSENEIDAVIHFAGYKAVGESVQKPIAYYRNNIYAALNTLEVMRIHGCNRFIFSSSATVYGTNQEPPLTEQMPTGNCTNPYGWTKYMVERILTDTAAADSGWSVVLLRYFNPIGAHASGLLGEKPNGIPNNLMPYITQVAAGRLKELSVFGNNYPTPDGTGVRDYIHVVDLARGHLAALEYAANHTGTEIVNLGTGKGVSVLELVRSFERVNGVRVPYTIKSRREGDVAVCYADTDKAARLLNWRAELGLEEMCRDAWNWERAQK